MILSVRFPDVIRARRHVNEADNQLQDLGKLATFGTPNVDPHPSFTFVLANRVELRRAPPNNLASI